MKITCVGYLKITEGPSISSTGFEKLSFEFRSEKENDFIILEAHQSMCNVVMKYKTGDRVRLSFEIFASNYRYKGNSFRKNVVRCFSIEEIDENMERILNRAEARLNSITK